MISGLMSAMASLFGVGLLVEQRDEQAQALVHLRRRQPDAVILVHRLDHVVDELLHQRIAKSSTCRAAARARGARDAPCARLSEWTWK